MKRVQYSLTLTAEYEPDEEYLQSQGITVEETVEIDRAGFEQNPSEFFSMFPNVQASLTARLQEVRPPLKLWTQPALF